MKKINITLEQRLQINKIISRKNNDITWNQATKFTVNKDETEDNISAIAEKAKTVYFENLQEDQYLHSLS